MGLLLTTIAGLVIWIVLWAIGAKSFDAFLITLLMVVVAAAVRSSRRTFRVTAGRPTSLIAATTGSPSAAHFPLPLLPLCCTAGTGVRRIAAQIKPL